MSAHGGIITSEFLENIRSERVVNPRIQPDSFATSSAAAPKDKRELEQQIVDSWDRLRERWDAISNRYLKMSVSDARSKWMIPLFRELGFDPVFNREDVIVDEEKLRFKLSHKGWNSLAAPIVHMVAPSQDLEEEYHEQGEETSRRGRNRSPHDELQTFLNVNKRCKWGIVANGILLRILREYFHTTTKGYVEFDVENIFREMSFTDFRTLYRMAHASRFLIDKEGLCHLEQFYKESVNAGESIGENLRRNVKKAIERLGNGFLSPDYAKKMIENEEFCRAYYSELLRVVYRLLFMLFAEQRAMLPTRDSLYAEEYSITRLRQMAESRGGKDEHHDLWEGLKVTFGMLKNGCPVLKVFGYNGRLFDDKEIDILSTLPCKNEDILTAIRHLTLFEEEHVLKRISYLDLSVEEIGSIYESLLDFIPRVFAGEQEIEGETIPANSFSLDPRGVSRKTTGSYYTHPHLVDKLVSSALRPVVEEKLDEARDKERALLSIKVCDPACGSGAFLIAATNFMAKELAKVRTGQVEPPDRDIRKAKRDVLQHCIYGVDLNPMAVELAQVSLWINSCVDDLPLNFLDHHIKCGNSLIGATSEAIDNGIPDDAFTPVEKDERIIAKEIKSRNKVEKQSRSIMEYATGEWKAQAAIYQDLNELPETNISQFSEKQKKYAALVECPEHVRQRLLADAWTASFFWSLTKDSPSPPTQATIRMIAGNKSTVNKRTLDEIKRLAHEYHFFHWYIEFPDIFVSKEELGFDVIIGNPPWERLTPVEKEFFALYDPEIAASKTKTERDRLIENLENNNPRLYSKWIFARRSAALENKFIVCSSRFPLTSSGEINTYRIFAELATNIVAPKGLAGMILKTGIVNAETCQKFLAAMIDGHRFVSVFDMTNKLGWFPSVVPNERFCLTTISGKARRYETIELASYCITLEDLTSPEHAYSLNTADISLMSPQSKTLPTFVSAIAADITRKMYSHVGVLVNEDRDYNPWRIRYVTMLHSSGDSALFAGNRFEELIAQGYELGSSSRFTKGSEQLLPLYEGKFIHLYNHRFGTFEGIPREKRFGVKAEPKDPTVKQLTDPTYEILPRYWVNSRDFDNTRRQKGLARSWMFALRNVCRGLVDARTTQGCICPALPATHSAPILLFGGDPSDAAEKALLFTTMWSSIAFDFIVRQKLFGANLQKGIIYEIAAPSPSAFQRRIKDSKHDECLADRIKSIALELVYVTDSLAPFAMECGYQGPPFKWDPENRDRLCMELDAIFFHVYGLSRDEAGQVLDTFPILRRRDETRFGDYRTKTIILKYFDEYSNKLQVSNNMKQEAET
jgi:methylase of polypeptide subunit release factors